MEIKELILKLASEKGKIKSSDVAKELKETKSRQYISSILRDLVRRGLLVKAGSTAGAFYVLPQNVNLIGDEIKLKFKRDSLEEHKVFNELKERMPFISKLEEHISSILFYAFTEMLNNAIEHSESEYIEISIHKDDKNIKFVVNDFGVGVFKNVMQKRKLQSELEAIQDILKGKTTTQPHSHSGEGIFFTSKIADIFTLESYGYRLRVDNVVCDLFIEELKPQKRGTTVIFTISLNSKKHLNDVFSKFVTEPGDVGFDKTEVKVRLYVSGTVYISRSQARRILAGLDKFKTIILDFDRVTTVGQAFADEIFRVFQQNHRDIKIEPIHMVEPVKFMVDRVEKPI